MSVGKSAGTLRSEIDTTGSGSAVASSSSAAEVAGSRTRGRPRRARSWRRRRAACSRSGSAPGSRPARPARSADGPRPRACPMPTPRSPSRNDRRCPRAPWRRTLVTTAVRAPPPRSRHGSVATGHRRTVRVREEITCSFDVGGSATRADEHSPPQQLRLGEKEFPRRRSRTAPPSVRGTLSVVVSPEHGREAAEVVADRVLGRRTVVGPEIAPMVRAARRGGPANTGSPRPIAASA